MKEVIGVVEKGQIKVPTTVHLPEGARVRITWDEFGRERPPLERDPLTEEDIQADIEWATGKRFKE